MSPEMVLNAPASVGMSPVYFKRIRPNFWRAGSALTLGLLVLMAWMVRGSAPYESGRGIGYALGLVGGSLMLGLLAYPLRKRLRFMLEWGALKHWFKFHMLGGIFGPLLILFHSTFHVGSLNAGVALGCMLLVVASGVVGRFIYRKIHHGLYGRKATLQDIEQALAREFESLAPLLQKMPLVKQEVERFAALGSNRSPTRLGRAFHFMSLGLRRLLAAHRLRRVLNQYAAMAPDDEAAHARLKSLLQMINTALKAVQHHTQFSTYEGLFSLWHVIHVPFLYMLVITAIVHVVAVHIY